MSRFAVLCLCFALSGVAALMYQTAWTRQFAVIFGTSELAVATVLAAYMGGLALGARLIEPLLRRLRQPVRTYALLEAAVALGALAWVPAGLSLAERGLVAWLGDQAVPPSSTVFVSSLYYLVMAFVTLAVPTALMGATLPLLTRDGVHSDAEVGPRIAALYACNTAGAVAGALLSALWILPGLGLRRTLWSAAALSLSVAVLAFGLLRSPAIGNLPHTAAAPEHRRARLIAPAAGWVLPLLLASGAVSFLHEVLWTRILQRIVGSSLHAFGIMVASFLAGIAVGGALGARLARSRESASHWLMLSQVGIAVGAVIAWYALASLAPALNAATSRETLSLLALLPLTCAIGVTYPLAVRVLADGAGGAASAAARVYSWNTVGAIIGALGGGFFIIPALRYEGAVRFAACASLALAAAALLLLRAASWRARAGWLTGLFAAALLFQPAVPDALLRLSFLRSSSGPVLYYGVGRSADVVVTDEGGAFGLGTNGLPEAAPPRLGAAPTGTVEGWMAALAVIARPATQRMLVVGFGGGLVIQAVPPSVRSIDAIELEPEVIAANRAIASRRNADPLSDARLSLVYNDARGALLLTRARYDAILSQPSHPWTAGASHLYTREFMQQARAHLNPGGVFVQWMSTELLDESLLRALLATLAEAFPYTRVYHTAPTALILMGSDTPIEPERRLEQTRQVLDSASLHFARLGLHAPEDVVTGLLLEDAAVRALAAGQRPITDDDNRLATDDRFARGGGVAASGLSRLFAPYDPLTNAGSFVHRELAGRLDFGYIGRRVLYWGGSAAGATRVTALLHALGDSEAAAVVGYMTARRDGTEEQAAGMLSESLARWPESVSLRFFSLDSELAAPPGGASAPSLPPAARASLAHLPLDAQSVIEADVAAATGQWDHVRALDGALAQVPWTAAWALQAAQLRCAWRIRVRNPGMRQQLGYEGIAIADRALTTAPDLLWYALRAYSAEAAGRPEVQLESIAGFGELLQQKLSGLNVAERELAAQQTRDLRPLLANLANAPGVDAGRLAQVRTQFDRAAAPLQ